MDEVEISVVTEAEFWVAGRLDAAQQYGLIRAALEKDGVPMGNLDLMIAAQSVAAGAVLVTHDRVFGRVKGIEGGGPEQVIPFIKITQAIGN